MPVQIETLCVGPLDVNCYIVACPIHKKCIIVDPGDSAVGILNIVDKHGWKVEKIINTHGHADHTGANAHVKQETGAPICIHEGDFELLTHPSMLDMAAYLGIKPSPRADKLINDAEIISLCECVKIKVLHTPGHTKGGVSLLIEDNVLTGDTLFHMSVGRTDLAGGDSTALRKSIMTKLFTLPDDTKVYPGHERDSSIGYERANNPFLTGSFA